METPETSPAAAPEFRGTLPFRSQQRDDPESNFDVSAWRCASNICECAHDSPCDAITGIYYGSAEDEVTKFCPRHFFEMHFAPNAAYELTNAGTAPSSSNASVPANTPAPEAKRFWVWADDVRRVYQEVAALGPKEAHEIAEQQPECWQYCDWHDDNGYRLSDEVEDLETGDFVDIDDAKTCKACGGEIDPWNFGMPLEEALKHRLAEVRGRAEMKRNFDHYCSLAARRKIGLALDILWDVVHTWDNDALVSYPDDMPSFDEYLAEIGSKLNEIEWK